MEKIINSNHEINIEVTKDFLSDNLKRIGDMVKHLDIQVNILIGLSSALFAFSISRVLSENTNLTYVILSITSALSALTGLYAVHPPAFMRKKGQKESLMYNKKIAEFDTPEEYYAAVGGGTKDAGSIIKEYVLEIHNVAKYYYRPKRELFKLSRNILLTGITLSLVSFLVSLLHK